MNEDLKYIIGLVFILIAGAGISFYILTKKSKDEAVEPVEVTEQGELEIEDLVLGEGEEAVNGKIISVHYNGTLEDGTQFDSSYDRGEPFEFTLGEGMVIQGWEQGFAGMKVGGRRKLTVPSHLGYGESEVGNIPANSTLIFEVELLEVKDTE